MIQPELFDVVELLVDLPDIAVQAGKQGTIVEDYGDTSHAQASQRAYEVEFANSEGETIAMRALTPDQFVVVWKSDTKSWVPLADRLVEMMEKLSEERQEEVLNFARSLYKAPA